MKLLNQKIESAAKKLNAKVNYDQKKEIESISFKKENTNHTLLLEGANLRFFIWRVDNRNSVNTIELRLKQSFDN